MLSFFSPMIKDIKLYVFFNKKIPIIKYRFLDAYAFYNGCTLMQRRSGKC